MVKKFEQIELEIKDKKSLSPIYLLTGDEPFYIDKLAEKFEQSLLEDFEKDFNLSVLYGRDSNLDHIISIAKQYPIMSEYRVVLIKEAQDIDRKEWNKLEKYLDSPASSTILIICYKYKSLDKSLVKKIDKVGSILESKKPYDSAIPQWITNYCKSIHFQIDPKATQLISDYLGNDLEKIANELSKLVLNLKQGEAINTSHVQQHIGISKEYNVFELQSAIASRDITKANKIIYYFEANPKENPIPLIMSSLFSFFSKILIASQVVDKTDSNIASAIGVNPYFAKDYIKATNIYPLEKLFQIMSLLRVYDLKTKGLDVSPYTTNGDLLKELIFKIMH